MLQHDVILLQKSLTIVKKYEQNKTHQKSPMGPISLQLWLNIKKKLTKVYYFSLKIQYKILTKRSS